MRRNKSVYRFLTIIILLLNLSLFGQVVDNYRLGIKSYNESDFVSSIAYFTKSIVSAPENINPIYYRGLSYIKVKNFEDAIKDFNIVLSLNATHSDALLWRGHANYQVKKFGEAQIDLKKHTEINTNSFNGYYYLGLVYLELANYQEGLLAFQKAIQINPSNYKAVYSRGVARLYLKDYANSIEDFEVRIAKEPTYLFAHKFKAEALIGLKRYSEAESVLKQILNLDEAEIYSLQNLVYIYQETNKKDEAQPYIKKLIKLGLNVENI